MNLKDLYLEIKNLPSYEPSEKVTMLFSELVERVIHRTDIQSNLLTEKEIADLQQLCSRAEYELEKYWATKIIQSENPQETLKEFPYYQNYMDLTRLEVCSLQSCMNHDIHKAIFVGGGPLPLTAIVLATRYNMSVTILDHDENAIALSQELIYSLKLSEKVKIIHADGASYNKYGEFNIVFVAALAGLNTKVKEAIFKQIKIHASREAHILARSSWGKRKLLYKPLSKTLYKYFKPLIEVHPHHEIVNSVVIMKNL